MSAATDPLPNAFAHEKSCVGLHEVAWGSKDFFGWGLAIAGNGHGAFEVLLQKVEDNHICYHAFLGTMSKTLSETPATSSTGAKKQTGWQIDVYIHLATRHPQLNGRVISSGV